VLYLIEPNGPLKWNDLPARVVLEAARDRNVDLARLDWPVAERPPTLDFLRVALRHGVACSVGIVVDAKDVIDLTRADDLRARAARTPEMRASLAPQDALMEKLLPGSAEYSRNLDAQIVESMERLAWEAEDDVAELLAAPVKPELVEHWKSLGGFVPDLA
jgi:hypothetical protein